MRTAHGNGATFGNWTEQVPDHLSQETDTMRYCDVAEKERQAWRSGNILEILAIADQLMESEDLHTRRSGYMTRGNAHELGGQNLEKDLQQAVACYRQAVEVHADTFSCIHLARGLMQLGREEHDEALYWIQASQAHGMHPVVNIAFARYYGGFYADVGQTDFVLARRYYLCAALDGRGVGLAGMACMSRKLRQPVRMLVVNVLRAPLAIYFALRYGREAGASL